ncbi:hypothetical protein [Marinobacterium mangrovicola]|uniref:Uncharacterized protein n=1 Tax=Marinobacterium mangrovicola TaxID=1476959 RepID=A0A4R1H7Q5_9GAMM|nr:hypothetical protein [Marinobacterium mangrovicola]TCK16413.1 hypothetical protein CLV83_0121 [Marinobacterium mangrovicola]
MSTHPALNLAATPLFGAVISSAWLRVNEIAEPYRYYLVADMLKAKTDALFRSADAELCLRSRDYVAWPLLACRLGLGQCRSGRAVTGA